MKVLKRNDKLLRELQQKRQFYEHVAITKGDADAYWASGFCQSLLIEKINQILNDVHRKQIIDVGCCDGRSVIYLAKQQNSVLGIDISYARLTRAKQKARKYSEHTLFVQSYAEILPVKEEIFDGVICTEVLEHVLDDDALLRGLSSVLKPNAWVLISIPNVSLKRYFDMRYLKRPIYFDPREHIREFTYYKIPWFENDFILIKDLETRFKMFGLNVVKRYGVGFELPLWVTKFKLGQLLEKYCQNKKFNGFLSTFPVLKNFSVYNIFILQKGA